MNTYCDVFEAEGRNWILIEWSPELMDHIAAYGAESADMEPADEAEDDDLWCRQIVSGKAE